MDLEITQVEVHASSLAEAKLFYVDILELQIINENIGIGLLALKAGNVRVSIFSGFERDLIRDSKKASTHFIFKTKNIETTFKKLKSKGVRFKNDITVASDFLKFISIIDPDGNTIEIVEYLRNPLINNVL